MGCIGARRVLLGAGLAVAIAAISVTAVLFTAGGSGTGDRDGADRAVDTTRRTTTTTTSTTTSTTTTTTTAPPAPEPASPPSPPAPEPAPEPAPRPEPVSLCSGGAGGTGAAVLSAMNGDRAANGLGGLCWNAQLSSIAQGWAEWMAANQSLTHQDLQVVIGGTPFSTMGENLIVGPAGMDAGTMEATWMASGSHRANILGGFAAAGVGIATSADGRWWVAVEFAG
jgi:uncharacterized protein YkwD